MIDLSRNENPFGPPSNVIEALRDSHERIFRYDSEKLTLRLAREISKLHRIPIECMILGNGAKGILIRLFRDLARVQESPRVLISEYSWQFYRKIARAFGWQIHFFELNQDFSYDVESILEKISLVNPHMVLITSPNNPTGNVLRRRELIRILENTPDKTIVILDETFIGFSNYDESVDLVTSHPNFGVIKSFSKYFALAGLRVGYGIFGQIVREALRIEEEKDSYSYLGQLSTPQAIGAITALSSQDYYNGITRKLTEQRELIFRRISQIGFKIYPSETNFLLVEIPENMMSKLRELLAENNIKIKFFEEENLRNYVRISIGTEEENQELFRVFKLV